MSLGRLVYDKSEQLRGLLQHHCCQLSLGDLFAGFLKFFSELDTEKNCITFNELVDRNDERMEFTLRLSWDFQPLIIQEIFNQRNAAFSISRKSHLKRIKKVFQESYEKAASSANQINFQDLCSINVSELDLIINELD